VTIEQTKYSIRGKTENVLAALDDKDPYIAGITKELLMVMTVAEIDKIEVTTDHYTKNLPEQIEIKMEGDKLMMGIIRES
jgi:hypothetical protein